MQFKSTEPQEKQMSIKSMIHSLILQTFIQHLLSEVLPETKVTMLRKMGSHDAHNQVWVFQVYAQQSSGNNLIGPLYNKIQILKQ